MSEWQSAGLEIDGKPIEGAMIRFDCNTPKGHDSIGETTGKYTVQVVMHPLFWPTLVLSVWADKVRRGAKETRAIRREVRKARRAISGWHGRWTWEAVSHE